MTQSIWHESNNKMKTVSYIYDVAGISEGMFKPKVYNINIKINVDRSMTGL